MTNGSGAKISDCSYGPFGEEVSCSPSNTSNHYKFTGKEHDTESNLDYFGARHYESIAGRFIAADPRTALSFQQEHHEGSAAQFQKMLSNPQTWNQYAFSLNNPLRYSDPSGEVVIANEKQANDEINRRKLQQQRAQLTDYAKDLAKQVSAGKLDATKALDMFYNKAAELTKNKSDALLIAAGSALDLRHSTMDVNGHQRIIGSVLTRDSLGTDSLHHFAFAAFNAYDNPIIPANTVAVIGNMNEDGPPYSEDSKADVVANSAGAKFGQQLFWTSPNPLKPSAKIAEDKERLEMLEKRPAAVK